jgi:prolipoprotein diacylglyceryltransferase
MLPILQIGPLALQTPGLVLLIGLWVGLSLAERFASRHNVDPNHLYNLTLVALIAGIIGSRLAYAARFPDAFLANPASLISLNPGLLDPLGGLAMAIIAATIYGQRVHLPLLRTLDSLTPTLAVLGIAVGLSNLASGTGYGAATEVPWAIELWGAQRHPSQVYESLLAAAILGIIWPGRKQPFFNKSGVRFLTFVAFSAGARLFAEGFRGDSAVLANGIRTAQIIAWGILGVSLFALRRVSLTPTFVSDPPEKSRGKKRTKKR